MQCRRVACSLADFLDCMFNAIVNFIQTLFKCFTRSIILFHFIQDVVTCNNFHLSLSISAMTSLLESEAVFGEKASNCGIPDDVLTYIKGQGVRTLAQVAFSVGTPGDTQSDDAIENLAQDPSVNPLSLGAKAAVRRFVFIAQTLAVEEAKNLVDEPGEVSTTELPPAERTARIRGQSRRLSGVSLVGERECGHICYNLVLEMLNKNCVQYLAPSKFVSRRKELMHEKTDKEIVLDSSSTLQVKDKHREIQCDTNTELLLVQALERRALALDLVGAATYSVVEQYNSFLMTHMQSMAPPGYSQVTVQQLLNADKHAWLRLSEKITRGLKRDTNGILPLDAELPLLQSDPKVTFHLLPLPDKGSSSSRADNSQGVKRAPSDDSFVRRPKKGRGKGQPSNLPEALKGKVTMTKTGKPICWAFNLPSGCASGVKAGGTCTRGLHVCSEPRCGKPHSMQNHPQGGA